MIHTCLKSYQSHSILSSTMEFDLPYDIVRAHVLPNMNSEDIGFLLEKSIESKDTDFMKNYLLPAYQTIGISKNVTSLRCKMAKSAIDILPFDNLVRFLTDIEFPHMCDCYDFSHEEFQQIWHHVIRRYEHQCLHCFVTCCPQCTWAAYHASIDVNILSAFHDLMAHSAHYPSFDHILRLLLKHERLTIDRIIDYLSDEHHVVFKNNLYAECREYMDNLNSWIDASNVPLDLMHHVSRLATCSNSKHGRWVWKQLKRIQKAIRLPKFAPMMRQLAKNIDTMPNIYDEDDDFDMYDDF